MNDDKKCGSVKNVWSELAERGREREAFLALIMTYTLYKAVVLSRERPRESA